MIETVTRKTMTIRPSGRSTDFISPSFGHGCLYNCTYCYMKRHKPEGLSIADSKSVTEILTEINSHAWFATVEKPNQTHEKFITYDISCNEDFALHAKYHDWKRIFDFFKNNEVAMGSFATKYVNKSLLEYNAEGKIRIRFSIMPEKLRQILEPNTTSITDRLFAVKLFKDAGYDVHLNFSPVVVYNGWLEDYKELFSNIALMAKKYQWDNDSVKAEVIFLTHNEEKHEYNLLNDLPGEVNLLWKPEIQETKISEYGGKNIRYKHQLKAGYIKEWSQLHDKILPFNTIRYIF